MIKKFKIFENQQILNKILDKIGEKGMDSLTPEEKNFLDNYDDNNDNNNNDNNDFDIDAYLASEEEFSDEKISYIEDFLQKKFKIKETDKGRILTDLNGQILSFRELFNRVRWEFSIKDKDRLKTVLKDLMGKI